MLPILNKNCLQRRKDLKGGLTIKRRNAVGLAQLLNTLTHQLHSLSLSLLRIFRCIHRRHLSRILS